MDKKKNGDVLVFLLTCFSIGLIVGSINKKQFKKDKKNNSLTIENYLNRLIEFDLTPQHSASELFFDLMSTGFHPQTAFDMVKEECIDAGEKFYD
jgi:tyrosine-protein phosphatase YwqE